MYKEARKRAGLSIEEAAFQLHIAPRTLCKYEAGETVPPPETVLGMSRLYKAPRLPRLHCRLDCAIGAAYAYEVLTGINSDVQSVISSLRQEVEEAVSVLGEMERLVRNKNGRRDFGDQEWKLFARIVHEWLDVEHNIDVLKISLGHWCDVSKLIEEHNRKCRERGYVSKEKAALQAAN